MERERIEGPLGTPAQLDGIVDIFHHQVGTTRIIPGATGIVLIEDGPVLFETLHLGIIDILGEGDESRGRRSVGSRHFVWRMG